MSLVLIFFCISCKKQTENYSRKEPVTLSGKWNYTKSFYSIGGPFIFISTKNLNQWILFGTTGKSFSSNVPEFKNATSYEIVDSTKVKLSLPSQQPDSSMFFYRLDASANELILSPADIICIDGCGYIFER